LDIMSGAAKEWDQGLFLEHSLVLLSVVMDTYTVVSPLF